ncbi:MAG: MFS transporter, partial [Pseudomonadota bacterium]
MPQSSSAPALDGAYAWTRLALSLLVALIGNAGMWAVIMVIPAVEADFGLDRAEASIPYTATMIGFALGNLLIGRMVDRMGAGWTLAASALVLAAGFWAATGAQSKWLLSAVQLIIGFASAASFGPLIADISHWFARRRGLAVAAAASGNYISGAVWPLVLAGWMESGDWRGAYLVLALASGAVMAPLALALLRRPPEAHLAAADAAAALAKREVN